MLRTTTARCGARCSVLLTKLLQPGEASLHALSDGMMPDPNAYQLAMFVLLKTFGTLDPRLASQEDGGPGGSETPLCFFSAGRATEIEPELACGLLDRYERAVTERHSGDLAPQTEAGLGGQRCMAQAIRAAHKRVPRPLAG